MEGALSLVSLERGKYKVALIMEIQTWDCRYSGEAQVLSTGVNSSIVLCRHHSAWPGPDQSLPSWETAIWSRGPFLFSSAETLTLCGRQDPPQGLLPHACFYWHLGCCCPTATDDLKCPYPAFLKPTLVPPCPSLQDGPISPTPLLSLEMMSCLQLEQ